MIDFIKTFGIGIILFVSIAHATLSYACGGETEEVPPTPTVEISL